MMAWSALGQFLGARGDTAVTRSCSGGAILTRHIISLRRPVPRARARLRDLGDVALGRRPRPQRPRATGDASADRRAAAGAAAFARCVLTPVVQCAASCSHSGWSASTARSPFGRRRGDVACVGFVSHAPAVQRTAFRYNSGRLAFTTKPARSRSRPSRAGSSARRSRASRTASTRTASRAARRRARPRRRSSARALPRCSSRSSSRRCSSRRALEG